MENPSEPQLPRPAPLSSHEDDSNDNGHSDPRDANAQALANLPLRAVLGDDPLPSDAYTFVAKYYAKAKPSRYADVLKQLEATLTDRGAKLDGLRVCAADREHLAWACTDTMQRNHVRDPDKAIVFVLKKLRDTYLEVRSAREKASENASTALTTADTGGSP